MTLHDKLAGMCADPDRLIKSLGLSQQNLTTDQGLHLIRYVTRWEIA